jgi:hypothetical protein
LRATRSDAARVYFSEFECRQISPDVADFVSATGRILRASGVTQATLPKPGISLHGAIAVCDCCEQSRASLLASNPKPIRILAAVKAIIGSSVLVRNKGIITSATSDVANHQLIGWHARNRDKLIASHGGQRRNHALEFSNPTNAMR